MSLVDTLITWLLRIYKFANFAANIALLSEFFENKDKTYKDLSDEEKKEVDKLYENMPQILKEKAKKASLTEEEIKNLLAKSKSRSLALFIHTFASYGIFFYLSIFKLEGLLIIALRWSWLLLSNWVNLLGKSIVWLQYILPLAGWIYGYYLILSKDEKWYRYYFLIKVIYYETGELVNRIE